MDPQSRAWVMEEATAQAGDKLRTDPSCMSVCPLPSGAWAVHREILLLHQVPGYKG